MAEKIKRHFLQKKIAYLGAIVAMATLSAVVYFNQVMAGVSADGNFTLTAKVDNADNIVSATNTQWVFTVTTTAELVGGDVIRFVFPTTTVGAPFSITSPTATAMTNISLFKLLGPSPVAGVSSTLITASSRPAFYGYVNATTTSGTAFSVTLGGVTNNSVAGTYVWQVEAGTLVNIVEPFGVMSATKFSATTTATLASAPAQPGGAVVSNVALADTDTTGFGLDGRDFTVTWTPTSSQPAGYQFTKVYIATSGVTLAANNVDTNGCNGGPCSPMGMFNQFSNATQTAMQFKMQDSMSATWSTSSVYRAWVYVSAGQSSIVSSSATMSPTYDVVSDTNAPQIMHMGAHAATANVGARLYAMVFDDQTSAGQFASPSGNVAFKLFYANNSWNPASNTDAVPVANAGELYSFTVPTTTVGAASNTFKYYLVATDAANNTRYFCASPNATSTAGCQNSPFTVNSVAAGSRSVSGKVTSGGNNIATATVFAGGYAKAAVTTDASGDYTITGLPNNDAFDFSATKAGYNTVQRHEIVGTVDKTGVNLTLNQGSFGFFIGDGGGDMGGQPRVMFSGPPDGMQGFPANESIRVGFNQPMDATTITTVSSATSSNVYLIKTLTGENVPGSVSYCANNQAAGCSALFSMDANTILFAPSSSLATSTQYTLIITGAVKSQSGQAVTGNRPEGGHKISFSTIGNQFNDFSQIQAQFGQSGMYMPPFVRSMAPAPGMSVAPNVSSTIEFDQAMSASTINSTNISLWTAAGIQVTNKNVVVSLDSNEKRFATIGHDALSAGEYEVRVLGNASSASNLPMRSPTSSVAFSSRFTVAGSNDISAPTIYPALASNSTGVATNKVFEFGFNEQLAFSTVNSTNITMYAGATPVSLVTRYDSGKNSVFVAPASVLSPNTVYTVTFGRSVTDLAGNGVATTTYSYTTGALDTTAPQLREARCDDYRCRMVFTEPMNHDTQSDSNWARSVINSANWVIERTAPSTSTIDISGKPMNYDPIEYAVTVKGVAGLAANDSYRVTASTSLWDVSENAISSTARIFNGKAESSKDTFGQFGGMGMFGPPKEGMMGAGVGAGMGEFKPMGFGNFTPDQFAMGQADKAYPFNPLASADSNVFQVRFTPSTTLATGNQVELTFPEGTNVANVTWDTQSPYYADFNQFATGVITGSAIATDTPNNKVTITLAVSGSPNANDQVVLDLKKITNPAIPKGPQTGGYTVGIKVLQAGVAVVSKTSMPYYIMARGTNTLVVDVVAGSSTSSPAANADGTVYLHGGGPGGPMGKILTMVDGNITHVDGTATGSITYNNLPDGCYFVGTEPYINLGGADYYGQMSPEPVCLNGGETKTKWMLLSPTSGGSTATMTIKMVNGSGAPYVFVSKDVDIFAGGPGRFVVKTLSGVTTTLTAGYQVKLNANGMWNIGMGPAMPKGPSGGKPADLGVMPPPPIQIMVNNIESTPVLSLAMPNLPPGVTYSNGTITYTFAAADKTVTGTVKDGSGNVLANVEVFMHRQGFGAPVFTQTNASGVFSLGVTDYGNYGIGVNSPGMPPVFKNLELRNESGLKVYADGRDTTGNLILTLKKASYTISGKVLDSNNNGIGYAPVMATDANGYTVFGQTSSDGSYTVFVDNGVWTVRAELPPSNNDTCGTFSKTVTVSGASQASQNITPSASACYTVTGSVTVGSALANVPLFVEQWNAGGTAPLPGGVKKGTATDSNGAYSIKLGAGTYRIGTWHPDYGELSATTTITTSTAGVNITVASTATTTFVFTGGTSAMNGFLELKNALDSNKRIGKSITGLNATTTLNIPAGTYNYFANVFGVGTATGSVVAGNNVTVDLGLSNNYITVTGTVYADTSTTTGKAGVMVTFSNASTTVSAATDANGDYSVKLKAGTYTVADSLSGYIPVKATNVTFNSSTPDYDFGGGSPDQIALQTASTTIEGTVYNADLTTTTEGYVWGTNASGTVVTAKINSVNGSYSLPIVSGVWTIKAMAPKHVETTRAGTVTSTVSQTSKDITLTAAGAGVNVPTSTTGIVAANTGGSLNDSAVSGIKLTAGAGVLEAGSSNVTLNFEKSYTAPDTANFEPLGNASFSIEASGNSTIKNLSGNAEIQFNYTSLLSSLPTSTSESDLQLMYYSPEKGEYVPVEGGYTVDTTNNTITGLVNHFTDFVIAYTPTTTGVPAAPTGLTATASSDSQISLSWNAVSGATLYNVHRSTDNVTYVDVASTAFLTYLDSGRSASTLYYYKITATNAVGEGASSGEAHATTLSGSGGGGGAGSQDVVPTNPLISFAGNALTTATNTVTLVLSAINASQMMLGNDAALTGGVWETYNGTKVWNLTPGLGAKTVYVKYKSTTGNFTSVVSAIITVVTVSPTATTTTKVVTPVQTTVVSAAPTVAAVAEVEAITDPESKIVITYPADLSFQPGEKLAFKYQYVNSGAKSLKVKIIRELVFNNKVIKRVSASKTLKPGAAFKGNVKETLARSYKPGVYTMRLKVLDSKNQALDQNGLNFTVEKLKKKTFVLGAVKSADGSLVFDAASLAKVKPSAVVPVTLKLKYSYTNNTEVKQTIRMTRELLNSKGKAIKSASGKWVMTPGEEDAASLNQAIPASLALGNYTLRVRALDWKTKAILAENSLSLSIEMK